MSLTAPLRDAVVTDERLFHLFTWAPIVVIGLILLVFCWRDRGRPIAEEEEDQAWSPPAPPDLASLETLRRHADRG